MKNFYTTYVMILPFLFALWPACWALVVFYIATLYKHHKTLKPIFAYKRSTLGVTMVFRSPFKRLWLFNISIGNNITLRPALRFAALLSIALVYWACDTSTSPVDKPKTHYAHFADTLWHDDMAIWNNGDTVETDYHTSEAWTSATVYCYQDTTKWTVASLTYSKPVATSNKPIYWDGAAIQIMWDRMPKQWTKIEIRFSRKEEGI